MGVEGRTYRPVVDHDACGVCSVCLHACPAERVPELRIETESLRGRIYGHEDPFALPFSDNRPTIPPCREACPLGQDVPAYVGLLARGMVREALDRILDHNPLPSVCGHICTRPCEAACTRARLNDPVPIRALKAFASNSGGPRSKPAPVPGGKRPSVAIVGSGPAGLTAAHDLARRGIRPLVLESHHLPGGMLAWAVPRFRLPQEALDKDIRAVLDLGVELKTGVAFGTDVTLEDLHKQGIRAVLLATGTLRGLSLDIPGEGSRGVKDGLAFLRAVNSGDFVSPGRQVLVVGGGNAAMDSARTARRLGSEVTVIYRRGPEQMPAHSREVREAEQEGVIFKFLAAPLRVLVDDEGSMKGLMCIRTELRRTEQDKRLRPFPLPGTEHEITGDALIPAIGQAPDLALLLKGLGLESAAGLKFDPATLDTGCRGVFAAGDLLTGPTSVVEAMACGRSAAGVIWDFLQEGNEV